MNAADSHTRPPIEIERKERTKREVQAQGIANAMQIIRGQLSAMSIQHEAIEAQKEMVRLAQPHGGLHTGRADGGTAWRHVQRHGS